ncbi:NhaP-type Na+/H+ and K+/H+ antiporter [Vibrio vulnificus]|nr:NhaP-type Na+/H+ and K+/H+ antiporter [Vibrio vulnificus]
MQTETIALWLAGIGIIGLACQWFRLAVKIACDSIFIGGGLIGWTREWLASARDSFGRFAFSYGVISGRCDSV